MARTLVIGGGIVGASAALALAEAGEPVTLVDRHDPGHATAAGAGIIAPGTSRESSEQHLPFAADAVRVYPRLVERLAALGAGDTRYEVVGELVVARSDAEFEQLPDWQRLLERRRADGIPNIGATEALGADEARRLFPALGEIAGAILVPDAARVDGAAIRTAMVRGAATLGAEIVRGDAHIVEASGDGAEIEIDGERRLVDRVIVTGGAWSPSLLEPFGVRLAIAPQKGQIMHITMDGQDTSRWPIIYGFGDQYILAFGPDRVVFGATRETGSGFDTRVTPAGLASVITTALAVAPGLAHGTLKEVRVGLRPLSADGLPFIGPVPGHEAVIVAAGHGPSGLQLGPWTGHIAAELAMGAQPSSDISAYAVRRAIDA